MAEAVNREQEAEARLFADLRAVEKREQALKAVEDEEALHELLKQKAKERAEK